MKAAQFVVVVVVVVVGLAGCRKNIPYPEVKPDADVARGQYLASHVMVCVSCHSARDWTRPGGPVVDGQAFVGSGDMGKDEGYGDAFSFGAPNLTPHEAHGLKSWSDGEIARAAFLGQGREGRGLFPLMPYRDYRDHIALDDVAAVVAFLRSLPPSPHQTPAPPRFPMPGFVLDGFPQERALKAKAPQPGDAGYGQYLAGIAGCATCHTNKPMGAAWAGGREFPVPPPGSGTVRSANLTPDDDTGLGRWTREVFIARFKGQTLEAARAADPIAGGFNTVMPWWAYAGMTDDDLGAIYDYLKTLPPSKNLIIKHQAAAGATTTTAAP